MKHILCTVINDLTYDQRMIRICTTLAENGYKVTLVGRILPHSKPLVERPFAQKRIQCLFNKGKLFYIEYNFRLLIMLLFTPFDVVCPVDLDTLVPGYTISRLRKKKCVYDAHEYFTELPEVVGRPVVKSIWEWVANRIIPRLTFAYTVGNSLAAVFQQKYGTPFEVIRNVPKLSELPLPDHRQKLEPHVIFYQGALNEGRGLEQAILAMKQIEGAQFWLAGEGDLSEHLREMVREEGLDKKVIFLGYVTPEALKEITPKVTIGLNLLENKGLSYYYSLANKTFDYIAAGIPVIQMNFPEYRYLNDQFEVAILISSLEVADIRSAILLLLNDPEFYEKRKSACKEAAKANNWEIESLRLLAFYKRVID